MSAVATAVVAGSYISGKMSGKASQNAANTSAAAQLQAAEIAADAQKFRPVGMTTRFGSSNFEFDDNGYLKSAGYNLSPEVKAYQDFVMGQTGQSLGDVQGLMSLGRGYLATSPEQAAADYIAQQNKLLAPSTQSQLSDIRSNLQRTGRGGLAVGQGGALAAANPELQAYYNALAQRDLQLGAAADLEARNRITFGTGLLSSAYSPLTTGLGTAAQIEALGQTPLSLGAELGGRSATAGANVGQSLLQGGLSAAKTLQAANQYSPGAAAIQGAVNSPALQNWFSKQINPTTTQPTPETYGYNPYQPDFGGFDANSTNTPGLWQTESYD